ncbi:MAG: hypothetical protein FD166_269 [Bacteroidetes bacterium]|nr:MAG: hypothetical protein FD166_269 [Bacteroidota bacterium]
MIADVTQIGGNGNALCRIGDVITHRIVGIVRNREGVDGESGQLKDFARVDLHMKGRIQVEGGAVAQYPLPGTFGAINRYPVLAREDGQRLDMVDVIVGDQYAPDQRKSDPNLFQRLADTAGTDAGIDQQAFAAAANKITIAAAAAGEAAELKLNREKRRRHLGSVNN